jgi:UDP-glucose:glycoprotein glucosyltransferase
MLSQDEVAALLEDQSSILSFHQHYVKTVLNVDKQARVILCNGRIIGPLDSDEEFANEDFSLFERFSQSTYGDKLFMKLIKDRIFNDDDYGITINYLKHYSF